MSSNNPPAFPLHIPACGVCGPHTHPGMTLRDYFAAKAMQSIVLAEETAAWEHENTDALEYKDHAEYAYRMADAMLAARENTGGDT